MRILLVAFTALIFAATASAFTQSGRTVYASTGSAFPNAHVTIHDNVTGANGSTNADSNGNYSFGGLVASDWYYLGATGCQAHSWYAVTSIQYNPSGPLPTLRLGNAGSC